MIGQRLEQMDSVHAVCCDIFIAVARLPAAVRGKTSFDMQKLTLVMGNDDLSSSLSHYCTFERTSALHHPCLQAESSTVREHYSYMNCRILPCRPKYPIDIRSTRLMRQCGVPPATRQPCGNISGSYTRLHDLTGARHTVQILWTAGPALITSHLSGE